MALESRSSLLEKENEGICKFTSKKLLLTEKLKTITSAKKQIVLKYKLEETDNKDTYVLINGPVYFRKSLIDLKRSLLQEEKHNSESKHNLQEELMTTENLNEIENEVNGFEIWRNCCKEGQFSIKELLDACEKDPNAILSACRKNWTRDKELPTLESCLEDIRKSEPISEIKLTHGADFGDAKYHYLMVDAGTSISDRVSGLSGISNTSSRIRFNTKVNEKENEQNFPAPTRSRRMSTVSEDLTILQVDQELQKYKKSNYDDLPDWMVLKARASIQCGKRADDVERPEVKFDVTPDDKHHSTVSWSIAASASHSEIVPHNETIKAAEEVVLEPIVSSAKVKMEVFHQFINVTEQYSLLGDIIEEERRRSALRASIAEEAETESIGEEPNNNPARCCGLIRSKESKKNVQKSIKNQKKVEEIQEVTSDDDDYDGGSSISADSRLVTLPRASCASYKARLSIIENPIFEDEAHHKINKYLSHM